MSDAGRLIVGTSGSPGILCALRYAEATARARHAVLIPAIAWEPPGGDRADRELGHSRLAWLFWHRPLTPEQVLRDQRRPAT